jgi:hypothetical protein
MDDLLAEINTLYDELVILENKEYEVKLNNINDIKKIKPKDMVLYIILTQLVVSFDPGINGIMNGKLNSHSLYLMYVFSFVYEQLKKRVPYL